LKNFPTFSFSRTFWILALILSSTMFCLLMHETTEKFVSEQIVIRLSENRLSVDEVPFPAVTLCPEVVDLSEMFGDEGLDNATRSSLVIEK
jgi:Amiloride-sensitive sodium channel